MISKTIALGSLEIYPEIKRIYLNGPNCVLRIQDIDFKNIEEKFSMIDIVGNKAYMLPGDVEPDPFSDFIEKMCSLILPKIFKMSPENRKILMDKILNIIEGEMNKCQS